MKRNIYNAQQIIENFPVESNTTLDCAEYIDNNLEISREECSKRITDGIKPSNLTEINFNILNLAYSLCLTSKGYPAENLFSDTTSVSSAINTNSVNINNLCQEDINRYTACMNEYNAKMSEYSACLSEVANPNSYRFGMYCSKPLSSCLKPICGY